MLTFVFPRAADNPSTDHIKALVSRQKDNSEGYNKHTRRVINNNAKYLQRNIGRPIHVEYSKFKKEERANNEIVRSGPVEDAAGRKETEEVEWREEDEGEAGGRDGGTGVKMKMKVTRVTSPEKIYLLSAEQDEEANEISRKLEGELEFGEDFQPTVVKLRKQGNPEPSLEVGGSYMARYCDRWFRATLVELIPGSHTVTLCLVDYHIFTFSCQVINIYDLPASLDFDVIPPLVR